MAEGAPDYGQYGTDYTAAGRAYSPFTSFISFHYYYDVSGSWGEFNTEDMISFSYHRNQVTDSYITLKFYGSFMGIVYADWNDCGIMAVSVDGGTETLIDTYGAKTSGWRNQTVFTDLADAEHTAKIRVTGTKNPSSGDDWIRVCGILVDTRRNVNSSVSDRYMAYMGYLGSTGTGALVKSYSDDYPVYSVIQGHTSTYYSAISGAYNIVCDTSGHLQVDVLTMPSVTVTATNLDIRDLAYASDSVTAYQGSTWSTGRTWTLVNTSDSVNAVQSGTWNIGTVTTVTGITNSVAVTSTTLVNAATTPLEDNVPMTNADTQYSSVLPAGCKKFSIQVRDGTAARFAFTTGKVATSIAHYETLPADSIYYEDNLNLTSKTIYFACAVAGKVMEVVSWS